MVQPLTPVLRAFARSQWNVVSITRPRRGLVGFVPCPEMGKTLQFQFFVLRNQLGLGVPLYDCVARADPQRTELRTAVMEIEILRGEDPGAFSVMDDAVTGTVTPIFNIGVDSLKDRSYWEIVWTIIHTKRECMRAHPYLMRPATEGERYPLSQIAAAYMRDLPLTQRN